MTEQELKEYMNSLKPNIRRIKVRKIANSLELSQKSIQRILSDKRKLSASEQIHLDIIKNTI